jgi:hypothetical protein
MAAMQAYAHRRIYPHGRFAEIIQTPEVNADFRGEFRLLLSPAIVTCHFVAPVKRKKPQNFNDLNHVRALTLAYSGT